MKIVKTMVFGIFQLDIISNILNSDFIEDIIKNYKLQITNYKLKIINPAKLEFFN